jgi:two-component system, NtrC family, sensor histidine kinase HydH
MLYQSSGVVKMAAHHWTWVPVSFGVALSAGVGWTAAWLAARRRRTALPAALPRGPDGSGEGRDGSQMPVLNRVILGLTRQFRTPVAAIEGAAWVLKDSRLAEDKRQELIGIVRKESHRLSRILSDVADFAQPHRPPRLQKVDLAALLNEVIQLSGSQDGVAPIRFHMDIAPGLPPVRCDPEQIRQVLLNLVMNAIQASPAGGQIGILVRLEGSNVVVTVQDSGEGIPAAARDQIFDPFFTTRGNNLGLGLPVALRIVAEHGGSLALAETSPQGTSISAVLPVNPALRP